VNEVGVRHFEVLISLLARSTIGVDAIHEVVTEGKKNPSGYIRAYNALFSGKGVTELAKIAGVAQPTMTYTLQAWEAAGIVYDLGEPHRPDYRHLLVLPENRPRLKKEGSSG